MAIVGVRELMDRGLDSNGLLDSRARRTWRIEVDSKLDDANTIAVSGVLPARFSPHPYNLFLSARKLKIDQEADKSWRFYKAVLEYSSEPLRESEREKEQQPNPTLRPARIRWRANHYVRPVVKDVNGDAILNSAGSQFDPPPEIDDARWTVEIEKNLAVVPTWLLSYANAINNSAFEVDGIPVATGKAKIQDLEIGERQSENGVNFRTVRLSIEFRKEGWALEILDAGFYYLNAEDELKRAIVGGTESADAVLLDGSGGILADPIPSNAVYISADVYDALDFSVLPLA